MTGSSEALSNDTFGVAYPSVPSVIIADAADKPIVVASSSFNTIVAD